MLNISRSTTLTGTSKVIYNGEEVVAMQFTANIKGKNTKDISEVVVSQDAYNENKSSCRADSDEFTTYVREIEDSMEE